MRVLVVGGFHIDPARVYMGLNAFHASYGITEMLHAPWGSEADRIAADWARRKRIPLVTANCKWSSMRPRKATKFRNPAMIAMKPDVLIAFKFGTGTMDMLRRATAAKIKIVRMDYN